MFKWIKNIFSSEKPLVLTDEVKEVKKKTETKPLVVKPSFKNKKELSSMTKAKLEEVGRVYGIELDRRLTKDKLVNQLWKSIK
jgi:fructose-1-phosphate kinase PfkB-like protein